MVHKNEKQTCHCLSASAGKFCNFLRQVFAKVNSLYVMIYKRNDSLRASTGPGIAFELYRVTRTESEHKNLGHTNLNICFSDPAGHILLNSKKKKGCGQVLAIINAVYRHGACA